MGKKKAKPSEQIACFLNFVDECERIYQTAYDEYSGRFYTPIPEIGNHRSDMKETAIPF